MELAKRAELAYSYAQEVSKQLLTLSTAVFALTLTFDEKIAKSATAGRAWLEIAWGCYLGSIFFGIVVLMTLAGHIAEPPTEEAGGEEVAADSIYSAGIRISGAIQIVLFFIALTFTFVYGVKAI
jgi:Ca2+/Na+ antiporter